MRDNKDKLSRSKLLEVLQVMEEGNRELELELDFYTWEEIDYPLQLIDALQARTKDDLYQMAQSLNLGKCSSLKKRELVDRLVCDIPISIRSLLPWLTEDHCMILKKLAARGGRITAESVDTSLFDILLQFGIVFTGNVNGKPSLVMAQEVVQEVKKINFKAIQPIMNRNTRWVKLTRGLLHYYGFLSKADLVVLLEQYTGEVVDKWDIRNVLEHALGEDDDIEHNTFGYHYFYVRNPEQVKQEHEMRGTLDYYPFTEQQLLTAGEPDYIDRDESYLDFVQFLLDNYEMDYEDADSIVEECMINIRNGDFPSDLLGQLQEQMELTEMELIRKLMDKLAHTYNGTRQWFLKGYSPKGMSPKKASAAPHRADVIDFSTRQKIGRNDPCPCGSGKKFKKCCGG